MREHRLIWLSSTIGLSVYGLLFVILPIYTYEISHSYVYAGLMTAVPFLVTVIMLFVWGSVSDYLGDRKRVIILTGLIGSSLFFLFPYLDVLSLLITRSVQTFFLSSYLLVNAMVTEYSPESRGTSIGNLNVFMGLGWALGTLLSGFLYTIGSGVFFYSCGVLGIFSALILLPTKEIKKPRLKTGLKGIMRFGKRKVILALCLSVFFVLTGAYMVYSMFGLFLRDIRGMSEASIGTFMAIAGFTGIPASWLAGKLTDRFSRKSVLAASFLGYTLVIFSYSVFEDLIILAIIWSLPLWSFFIVSATARVSDVTEITERGRGVGVLNSAIVFGAFFGSLLGGIVAQLTDFSQLFRIGAVFALVGFLLAVFTVRAE